MGFASFVIRRYLKVFKDHIYIGVGTLLAAVGIFLGVVALVLVVSMMRGLEHDIRTRLEQYQPDVVISAGGIPLAPEVRPLVADVAGDGGRLFSVLRLPLILKKGGVVKGVDMLVVDAGYLRTICRLPGAKGPFLYLGNLLAIDVGARRGRLVELLLPFAKTVTTTDREVTGVIESGLVDIDLSAGYASSDVLADLGLSAKVNELHIAWTQRPPAGFLASLREALPRECVITTLQQRNKDLFAAMALERVAMVIMLSIIILLASFNISSSLMMLVGEKKQEIGIIRVLGGRRRHILRIFTSQGFYVGLTATLLGIAAGSAAAWALDHFQLISAASQGLYLDFIPFRLHPLSLAVIFLISIAITLLSSYIPARNAAKMPIIEALKDVR